MKRLAPAANLLLLIALAACATSGLDPIVLDANELHASLAPKQLDGANHGVPPGVRDNPHYSTDAEVRRVDRGYYGMEAASTGEADRIEGILREIWAFNVHDDRIRVHRLTGHGVARLLSSRPVRKKV
ncbi:MAG: hypothetical protein H8E15_02885 [Planctomycetes bacterium]|nr:hypothetical protein [Planctomycetota bacterium]